MSSTINVSNMITVAELRQLFKMQGVSSREHVACKCVICGTVQSPADFMRATGKPIEEIEKYFGFSCIGRFTNAGPWKQGDAPGKGCDWTLGGLLRLHRLVVVTPDGDEHPFFDIASAEEAQAHERSQAVPA